MVFIFSILKSSNKKTYNTFIDTLTELKYLTCQLARGNKKYMGMGKIDISPCHRRIDIIFTLQRHTINRSRKKARFF